MRTVLRILKTELRVFFGSPIAWLILIVFAFQVGSTFCSVYEGELRYQDLGNAVRFGTMALISGYRGVFTAMLDTLYLYIPLLTMGLMSRELNSGSIKLLYSSPVSNREIIFGKYLSTVVFGLILVAILILPTFFVQMYVKDADTMMMVVAAFGVFITICAYAAIGLFMSTLTRYQVVAVVSTLIVLAILNFIGNIGQEYAFVRDITFWLSISGRSKVFLEGMLSTRELAYFVLVIGMFLSLSIIKLRGERLRPVWWKSALSYLSVLVVVFALGFATSSPKFIAYYDATQVKSNTLTPYSQEIVDRIDDGLTITTYGNVLDETYYHAESRNRNYDLQRFQQYQRFKPEIKQKYVKYYAQWYSNPRYDDYADDKKSPQEWFDDMCKWSRQDPTDYLTAEQLYKLDDIEAEGGRLVRVLSRDNGRKAILRVYNDSYIHPFEDQITTAMKTLVDKSPVVSFITGHGERSSTDYGENGYGVFSTLRTARYALINAGFTIRENSFESPIPIDVDIVIISDVKSPFSEVEMKNYNDYIERGGNLILLGEPRRQEFMNPLIEQFGLKFMDNLLVQPTELYSYDFIPATITAAAGELSPSFMGMANSGYTFTMSSACAIEQLEQPTEFRAVDLMVTDTEGVWLETKTRDFLNEKPELNPEQGEVERSYTVASYVSRDMGGENQQRIFILGDSDCFTSKEFGANRAHIYSANYNVINELMYACTYGEFPINVGRVPSPDTEFTATYGVLPWMKGFYKWLVPLALLAGAVVTLVSRKRK